MVLWHHHIGDTPLFAYNNGFGFSVRRLFGIANADSIL